MIPQGRKRGHLDFSALDVVEQYGIIRLFVTLFYAGIVPPRAFCIAWAMGGVFIWMRNILAVTYPPMFDEPEESPDQQHIDPMQRARDRCDAFRMHAELAAVFEATRKFEAELLPGFSADLAREIQRTIGKLEKSKITDTPIIDPSAAKDAAALLEYPTTHALTTNDYHLYQRPGELMSVRWLEGDQVDTFYERLQAHFDAALSAFRAEERAANEWKQDPQTLKYLEALDALEVDMAQRYLRPQIKEHRLHILSTQTADELDILYLCDYILGAPAGAFVGEASAPPEEPTEQDRAWFFKLFSLRGIQADTERMCFFAYFQKTEESW